MDKKRKITMKLLKIIFPLLIICSSCSKNENVRFAICADVHQDIIHDAPNRIKTFVEEAKMEKVDFIIQLGDFCFPVEENKPFLEIWNSFPGHKYHILGNHDMDICSKQEEMEFLGMKKNNYSFDQGAFHFIVLDPNYFVEEGKFSDYEAGNYFKHAKTRATIPPAQIEWLKNDISQTDKLVVVFSHQNLEGKRGVKNQMEIRKILEDANSSRQKVIACFSGHDHDDLHSKINGIHYIRINSMSYEWVGKKYQYQGRFTEEIDKYRPALKYTLPFAKPVFAIVEIDPNGLLLIKGKKGAYVLPGPDELDVKVDFQLSPSVSDRSLKF